MTLPLMMAGPILRRVEPHLVAVWVALSEPRDVTISIWQGSVTSGTGTPRITGAGHRALRIGERLYLSVATVEIPEADRLRPGQIYSYDVELLDDSGRADRLESLGLLENGQLDGHPHLALGYSGGRLPSFSLPPTDVTDLRILHGSCRKIEHEQKDGLTWVDDLIQKSRVKADERPHQLFMSGDQLYADDVAKSLLPQLITRARELLAEAEYLPTRWPHPFFDSAPETEVSYWPADEHCFPPSMRHRLLDTEARFTTSAKADHLISFGEFAANYLYLWSNVLWQIEDLQSFDEMQELASSRADRSLPENWGAIFHQRSIETGETELTDGELEAFLELVFVELSAEERRRALKTESYLGGNGHLEEVDGEQVARPALDPDDLLGERLSQLSGEERARFAKIYDFAEQLPATGEKSRQSLQRFFVLLQDILGGVYEREFKKDDTKAKVEEFYAGLPKVRRALANVPTYLMFDDHDVTDDWNLNPMWRDRVYTSPLARAIVRNGLLAYALFQGWGNDPAYFKTGRPAQLLGWAQELFPAGASRPTDESTPQRELDTLFGLDGADPPVHWHYSVRGSRHLVLVLDNRTRRSFVSRIGPPGNVDRAVMLEQIPEGPLPSGLEVLFVVASLPVIGPPVFDEIIAPLAYRAFDLIGYVRGKDTVRSGMAGTDPDAIEAWAMDAETFEALLERLAPYRRVVFLSGDVHYGSSQAMSYWRREDPQPTRFAQFTSSGLRNVMPDDVRLVSRSFGFTQRLARAGVGIERLGWRRHQPPPVALPTDHSPMPRLRSKLKRSPVLIAPQALPERATIVRPPDWQWRVEVILDQREPDERPAHTKLDPLPGDAELKEADPLPFYGQVASSHAKQLRKLSYTRQLIFNSNLGEVSFKRVGSARGDVLTAIGKLYAVPPDGLETPAEEGRETDRDPFFEMTYAVHQIPLDTPDDPKPRTGPGDPR